MVVVALTGRGWLAFSTQPTPSTLTVTVSCHPAATHSGYTTCRFRPSKTTSVQAGGAVTAAAQRPQDRPVPSRFSSTSNAPTGSSPAPTAQRRLGHYPQWYEKTYPQVAF